MANKTLKNEYSHNLYLGGFTNNPYMRSILLILMVGYC